MGKLLDAAKNNNCTMDVLQVPNKEQYTPLGVAVNESYDGVVEAILSRVSQDEVVALVKGCYNAGSALHLAVLQTPKDSTVLQNILKRLPASDVGCQALYTYREVPSLYHKTPLHIALKNKRKEFVLQILQAATEKGRDCLSTVLQEPFETKSDRVLRPYDVSKVSGFMFKEIKQVLKDANLQIEDNSRS
eukprot:TRINITY_DN12754_c1_g1_i2.p1 TRINITY_DN12754_c1_g1~~TRINITY_DN12754_c1_g1_i2.p1  ORF type:complete len:190 (-),score=26.68 TRINITY_DN12754_c1_g1_i2:89-658(-)